MIKTATAFGLAALMLFQVGGAGAQTTETRSGAAAAEARAERERIRRLNRALLLPRDATREERRLNGLQQLQNDRGARAYDQARPDSAPVNRQNGTVRTQ